MVVAYIWFTFAITRWRIQFRRDMNESDTEANTKAVDSLLNYETVKYFNNEAHETRRFDKSMEKYRRRLHPDADFAVGAQHRPGAYRGAGPGGGHGAGGLGIVRGHLTVGDLVMANAYL